MPLFLKFSPRLNVCRMKPKNLHGIQKQVMGTRDVKYFPGAEGGSKEELDVWDCRLLYTYPEHQIPSARGIDGIFLSVCVK